MTIPLVWYVVWSCIQKRNVCSEVTALYFECLQAGPVCHTNPAWMTLFQQAGICHWTALWGSPTCRLSACPLILGQSLSSPLYWESTQEQQQPANKIVISTTDMQWNRGWKMGCSQVVNHSQLLYISMEVHARWLCKLGEGHEQAIPWYADLREKDWHGLCLSERILCVVPVKNLCTSLMQKHSLHWRIHSVMIKDNGCWWGIRDRLEWF